MNLRRTLKHLIKNVEREARSYEERNKLLQVRMREMGFLARHMDVAQFLFSPFWKSASKKIKGSTIARIGRAARRQNKVVCFSNLVIALAAKLDPREIPFQE